MSDQLAAMDNNKERFDNQSDSASDSGPLHPNESKTNTDTEINKTSEFQRNALGWLRSVSGNFKDKIENATATLKLGASEALQDIRDGDLMSWLGSNGEEQTTLLPWEDTQQFNDEIEASPYNRQYISNELKVRILRLSKESATFAQPPPPSFEFSLQENISLASMLLKTDETLALERYKRVPALMKDETFWRTYFCTLSDCIENMRQEIVENRVVDSLGCGQPDTASEVTVPVASHGDGESPHKEAATVEQRTESMPAEPPERKNSLDEALKQFESSSDDEDDKEEKQDDVEQLQSDTEEKQEDEEIKAAFEKKWFGDA